MSIIFISHTSKQSLSTKIKNCDNQNMTLIRFCALRGYRTRLESLLGTKNKGFCSPVKLFFGCMAVAMEAKNDKIPSAKYEIRG